MIDIIDRIDDVTSSVCGWCSTKLSADSHSGDFCSEAHQESWNRDRAGLTGTSSRVASMVRHTPGGDEVVLDIVVDTSHFERMFRAVQDAFERMSRAAIIPQRFLFGDWTDIGYTVEGVLEAAPADEPLSTSRAERMQAALDARRNRNTGPQRRPRAPKNLGGRTSR